MELSVLEIVTRVGLAFVLSVIFGLERQVRRKQVGFSTFSFVSVGACVLVIIGTELATTYATPVTLIGGIITGIGFLGAGALIKPQDKKVFGFTTAASIWAFASLGIAIGAGLYVTAIVFYAVIIAIILIDNYFERIGFGYYARTVHVTVKNPAHFEKVKSFMPKKTRPVQYDFNTKDREYTVSFVVNANRNVADDVPLVLSRIKEIKRFKID